jgi:Spy/CpxP family protein refolding chaperone
MLALVAGLLMVMPSFVSAQDQPQGGNDRGGQRQDRGGNDRGGGPGGGGMRGFDPQQMAQRMKEAMNANDEEWQVLQPKIEKVANAQRDLRGGFFGRRGGFGGGQGGGDQPTSAVQKAREDLRNTLQNQSASADEIAAKLKAYREARDKAQQDLQTAQKELKDVLTQRQEAVLVSFGMID